MKPLLRSPRAAFAERQSQLTALRGGTTPAQTAIMMRPFFAPASSLFAPRGQGTRGGRTTAALTSTNQPGAAEQPPQQTTRAVLSGGQTTWAFDPPFNDSPNVSITPQGFNSVTSGGLYVASISPNEVIVKSENNADDRLLYLTATGNPA